VSLYYPDSLQLDAQKRRAGNIDQKFLRDYIQYARTNVAPEIGESAVEVLVRGYLAMRALGDRGRGGKTITATTRQLESLIRLSQALAKMRLSEVVTGGDVDEAIRLMKVGTLLHFTSFFFISLTTVYINRR
jgi:DNA replication licensing factor MCM4